VFAPRRTILGGYFSGEVAALGKGASGLAVGDAVFGSTGLRLGAYGEYAVLDASATIVEKPRNMTFEQAAAVPLGGLNALHFLRLAEIRAGARVLVNGAGGSIGAHAVQIAKAMGAEVTAVDSALKQGLLRELGVDHFVDYRKEDFTQGAVRYDVIFDMVVGSDYAGCIRCLTPGGRYVCGNPTLAVMLRSFFTNRFTDKRSSFAFASETREELSTLRDMIERGEIRPIVDRVLTAEQAAEAHRMVETEQRCGAIVLRIAPPATSGP
jgi:NADPH:quinone reductase-like Zn-dependent oxidoreductase